MTEYNQKNKLFAKRTIIIMYIKIVIFTILISRFFYLQIVTTKKYKFLSIKNKIRIIKITPPRGKIFDQNNIKLVFNSNKYVLYIKKISRESFRDIIKKLKTAFTEKFINYIVKKLQHKKTKQLIINNLTLKQIRNIKIQSEIRNFKIVKDLSRIYKFKNFTFHVIGYVVNYFNNILIGQNGIEKSYNSFLNGKYGIRKLIINSRGEIIKYLEYIPPCVGNNISLSVDNKIQKIILNCIKKKVGSISIMNLKTNKIIGINSSPTIDSNFFTKKINYTIWNKIKYDQNNPLINRAISSVYNPGSTFKIIIFLSILHYNVNPNELLNCTGSYNFFGKKYYCHNLKGHGWINIDQALNKSCNIYFYHKSLQIGIEKINKIARIFGLGKKTGIKLPFENPGLLPTKLWKKNKYKTEWVQGDTLNVSIGQGYIQSSNIQLLQMISRVATGKIIKPLITQKLNPAKKSININIQYLRRIRKALYINTKINNLIGKTGTSQIVRKENSNKKRIFKDHSIFVGYTPYYRPKYSIAIIIENGGWGRITALPIAINILYKISSL